MNIHCSITLLLMILSCNLFSQEKAGTIKVRKANVNPIEEGKLLFKKNCAVCHSEYANKITGPGLAGATKRAPSMNWLITWVQNCNLLIEADDPYALKIYNENGKAPQTIFTNLTAQQIKNIFAYIDSVNKPKTVK